MAKRDYGYRYDRKRAAKLLTSLVPIERERQEIARLICDAISAASDAAPGSWVFRADPHEAFLNVGQVAVVTLDPSSLGIHTTQLRKRPTGLSHYHSPRGKSVYAAVDAPSTYLEVEHSGVVRLPAVVRTNLRAFVRAAAADKSRSPWKGAHSPAVVDELAHLAGVELAQPAYWGAEHMHEEALISPGDLARDLESMRKVERAAVDFVTSRYRRAGWSVHSRESEKVGYDLECRRAGEVRHVEVKGRSAHGSSVILTSGEWKRAQADRSWMLSVVSFATSPQRTVREYTGRQVRASVTVDPVAFRVGLS